MMVNLDLNIIALVIIALANLGTAIISWRMRSDIVELKHNTNSIKDALVEASEAKGIVLGRAQEKHESTTRKDHPMT